MVIKNRFYLARLLGRGLQAEDKMKFILAKIHACVEADQIVELSAVGLGAFPVQFVNEVLRPLIDEYGEDFFKSHVKLSGVSQHDRFMLVNNFGNWVHEIII